MTDAISRSAVLESIYEMDISDCTDVDNIIDKAYAMIADTPSLDVAPVVRCKDCIHNEGLSSGNGWCKDDIICNYHMSDGYADDDFCSHGVRKDSDEDV